LTLQGRTDCRERCASSSRFKATRNPSPRRTTTSQDGQHKETNMIETWKALFTPAREWLASLPLVGDLGPYAALTLAVWAQSVLCREIWRSTRRPSCSETPHRCAGNRSTQRTSERTTLRFRRLDRGSAGTQFTTQLRRPVRSRKRHASQQV